ncbi:MAG: polysaccharide deacetylase, partial [Gillisia sp.]
EMSLAAKNNEIYHLWWHPHNFGENPKESLNDLRTILRHYKSLQKENNFQSVNMEELGSSIKNGDVVE